MLYDSPLKINGLFHWNLIKHLIYTFTSNDTESALLLWPKRFMKFSLRFMVYVVISAVSTEMTTTTHLREWQENQMLLL